jgi:hypothetical protein
MKIKVGEAGGRRLVFVFDRDACVESPLCDEDLLRFSLARNRSFFPRQARVVSGVDDCLRGLLREYGPEGPDEDAAIEDVRKNLERYAFYRPLYCSDHSLVSLSLSPLTDPWDSGCIGMVHMSWESVREALIPKEKRETVSAEGLEEAAGVHAWTVISSVNDYFLGNVWHYRILDIDTGDEMDACCGLFGGEDEVLLYLVRNLPGDYRFLSEAMANGDCYEVASLPDFGFSKDVWFEQMSKEKVSNT